MILFKYEMHLKKNTQSIQNFAHLIIDASLKYSIALCFQLFSRECTIY